ncbi:MAG: BBP7 family outer membrane beta-barrel protein [Planctomycetales bacterium]|nr:BBP7 family outer membrane beta-barrel protein [Planctomycetales bacterium]MCA9167447.1 BBP7 family outer membrane beta-barrel protein [Planctomycetales bacterium]
MKRILCWGAALTLWAAPALVRAESPWGGADRDWNGSFLSPSRHYTARRLDEGPKVPVIDENSLPSPSDTPHGSGLAPTPISNQISQSLSAYPNNYMNGPITVQDLGGGCNECGSTSGDCGCNDGMCDVGCGCGSKWFGGIYGLYMNRRNNFPTYLSYDSAAAFPPALTTNSTGNHFGGGFETWVGRYLNDCWSVAAGYWGFFPSNQTATAYNSYYSGDLSSAILYTGLSYNNGAGAQTLDQYYGVPMNPAAMHVLTRSFQAHNFELNFIRNPYRNVGNVHFELLAGVRYLKLDDGLIFSADNNTMLGDDPNNELHHIIDVKNHLVGFQIGGRADRCLGSRCSVHVGSKLGIYNNHITHFQRICGGNGNAYVTGMPSENYYIDRSEDNISFVGELFAGAAYQATCNWRLTGGYRAVSACGVGLATSQFPREREFASVTRSGQVNAGDCLLLHGAYFGAEYNW